MTSKPYQTIFERVEKKYLLTETQYREISPLLQSHMQADPFAHSLIHNLYFDTPNYQLIRTSLEKPVYKEKLRIRSYGVPKGDSEVFVELKKKYQGVVYKRRISLDYASAIAFLCYGVPITCKELQILKEIQYFLDYYGPLQPAMVVSYERDSFFCPNDQDLRITFDSQLLYRDYDLNLTQGVYGQSLFQEKVYLMELKCYGAMPLWLSQLLNTCEVYPHSFSKYGKAYENMVGKQSADTNERPLADENRPPREGDAYAC